MRSTQRISAHIAIRRIFGYFFAAMCVLTKHNRFCTLVLLLCVFIGSLFSASAFQSNTSAEPTRVIKPLLLEEEAHRPALVSARPVRHPKLALVLSGGGARGIAAIGALKVLERAGVQIDLLVGTSVGSIIGGLYAAGYTTEQLHQLVDTTNWNEVLNFSDAAQRSDLFLDQKLARDRSILTIRFKGFEPIIPQSFSSGQRLTSYLNLLVLQGIYRPSPHFDHLRVPFRAVTTDLLSGKQIVLREGDLTEAMRASASVPLLFSPVPKDTAQLLDGGLISNIPVDVARQEGAELVVAVDVTSPTRSAHQLHSVLHIAEQVIGIAMQRATEEQRAKANVVIRPDIGDVETNDFTRVAFLIQKGEEATLAALPTIQALIRERTRELNQSVTEGRAFENAHFLFDAKSLGAVWLDRILPVARKQRLEEWEVQMLVNEMYASGEFERVEVAVYPQETSVILLLHADSRPLLRAVTFRGNTLIPTDSLRPHFEHLLGRRANNKTFRIALDQVLLEYRSRGYSLARIDSVSFDSSAGLATITLSEGVVYRRDIRGTEKTKDYVLWRELPWDEGEILEISKVAQSISNLYGTNLFENVAFGLRDEEGRNIIEIRARERNTELIRFGLRIDNERNVQPSIDVRDENLFGVGAELGALVYGGSRNRMYAAEFKATRIFDSYLTFNLKAYYGYRDVNVFGDEPISDPKRWHRVRIGEYRELKQGGSVTFGTQLERLGAVTVQARLETHRLWSIAGDLFPTESYKISSIKFGTTVDNLDRFPYPRNGVAIDFAYESALLKLRGGVGFTKTSFSYETYHTYAHGHTLRPRILFGFADETLPLSEQFSLGGQHTFFGLREDNARGRQLLVVSLEYRYASPVNIFFDTYLKARYDFGSIWAKTEQIRLKNLRHGIGLSLALDTPIGPAEFAVGRSFYLRKELLDTPLSVGPTVLYFSIGRTF